MLINHKVGGCGEKKEEMPIIVKKYCKNETNHFEPMNSPATYKAEDATKNKIQKRKNLFL